MKILRCVFLFVPFEIVDQLLTSLMKMTQITLHMLQHGMCVFHCFLHMHYGLVNLRNMVISSYHRM